LPLLSQARFYGVMLDTAAKNGKSLGDSLDEEAISRFVKISRSLGLLAGLAGSLSISDIPEFAKIKPHYLGFRGALCRNSDRKNEIDCSHLTQLIKVLRKCNNALQKPMEFSNQYCL
jgi:uncharacterized protein (UPF0264 family)